MNPVTAIQQQPDGMLFIMKTGALKVQVCTASIVHLVYSATWLTPQWTMRATDDEVTILTSRLKVSVTRKDGAITYRDLEGKQLVQEATRKLTPVRVNGENTYRAECVRKPRGFLWARPTPGWSLELSGRISRYFAGQTPLEDDAVLSMPSPMRAESASVAAEAFADALLMAWISSARGISLPSFRMAWSKTIPT